MHLQSVWSVIASSLIKVFLFITKKSYKLLNGSVMAFLTWFDTVDTAIFNVNCNISHTHGMERPSNSQSEQCHSGKHRYVYMLRFNAKIPEKNSVWVQCLCVPYTVQYCMCTCLPNKSSVHAKIISIATRSCQHFLSGQRHDSIVCNWCFLFWHM